MFLKYLFTINTLKHITLFKIRRYERILNKVICFKVLIVNKYFKNI